MSEAVETNPIQDLINHSLDQDFTKAGKTFGDIMTLKMNDILDQEKIRLSDQIYNGVEDEQEQQLELDIDADEIDDEVSGESPEDQGGNEEDAGESDDETEDESEETEENEDED